jgi:hypothetical protein
MSLVNDPLRIERNVGRGRGLGGWRGFHGGSKKKPARCEVQRGALLTAVQQIRWRHDKAREQD